MRSSFSLAAFQLSSLPFDFQHFYCNVFVCESLCVYLPWSIFLASWICRKLFINKFGEFPAIINSFHFLCIFLLSYYYLSLSLSRASETPIMITLLHLLVSHISLRLFSIVFILLFLCSLAESLYHSPSISLIFLKFKSTNLSLSGNFFLISVILLFSSRISFWFSFQYFFIDISILFIQCFLSLPHVFF